MTKSVLPDLLRKGLNVVFVGTAASDRSAAEGHYYANPRNRFWQGSPTDAFAAEDHLLPNYSIGLTDVVKSHHSGSDAHLPKHLYAMGREQLEAKLRCYAPYGIG